jgi:oligopeptidase B
MKFSAIFSLIALLSVGALKAQVKIMNTPTAWPDKPKPPVAIKKPSTFTAHGDTRVDDYFWMNAYFKKGPDSNMVIKNLKEENDYYKGMMAATEGIQERLYDEMKARIKEKDESVPTYNKGYYYYSRVVEGKDYFLYCRKKGNLEAPEEVLLDVNAMAEGHNYFSATGFDISPDNKLLAYGIDVLSRRQYKIYVKNLETGKIYSDEISNTEGNPVWAADNKTFFYTSKNQVTLLSEKIMRHQLGEAVTKDAVVYQEKDPSNYIYIERSKSDEYLFIVSRATLSAETRILKADNPLGTFQVFQPRMKEVLYEVNHANNQFYILTNWSARNFRIMTCAEAQTAATAWKELVPHDEKILIQSFDCFKDYLVISERSKGLSQIHIFKNDDHSSHYLAFDEPTYTAGIMSTPDYLSRVIRFNYTSLTTPSTVFDYDMQTREKKLMKQQEVLGGFNASNYVAERIHATASDGTLIPISLVYRKGYKKDGLSALLMYGYGSYGSTTDASFSSVRLSLLDRGFCFAIAHIRGGQEMGRYWYEDAKMMKKKNSFTDFIACAEFLVKEKYTSPAHLYASGGSAGGLLMGAIVNMRPELWHGVIAAVPFVDVINTMSDASIPLTTNEYDEWGNPADKESYFYMKSYSPYENVARKAYPNMLVTTGLHDSQVQYFEPQKWVAKLRDYKTDHNILLLYTNMEAGHGGASGRFKSLRDRAREYAFLLTLEGMPR